MNTVPNKGYNSFAFFFFIFILVRQTPYSQTLCASAGNLADRTKTGHPTPDFPAAQQALKENTCKQTDEDAAKPARKKEFLSVD